MTGRSGGQREVPVPVGRRLTRRAFLRAMAASGLATVATGAAASGALRRPEPAGRATVDQLVGDPIAELAASLSYDLERIFRFVADEIRYEPYVGILRGARGTLAGRAGNSVDQALLLAALLEASLLSVRFVRGPLQPGQAEALLAAATTDAASVLSEAMAVMGGGGPDPEPLPPELMAILDQVPELDRVARTAAEAQAEHGVRSIVDALAGQAISFPAAPGGLPSSERDDHVWLQASFGTEWLDLDPTLPGLEAGQVIASAAPEPLDRLPDELRHRVELVATAERISGTSLAQEPVLEFSGYADALAGRPMLVLHVKPGGLDSLGIAITGALTGAIQYVPVLDLGDRAIVGGPLTFAGQGGLLDELGGEPSRSGEATAEWLEVRTISPDGSTDIARRTVFDRVGVEARQSGAVDIDAIPLLELTADEDETVNEYPPLRTAQAITVATGPTAAEAVRAVTEADEGPLALLVGGLLFHLGRDALLSALGPAFGVRLFLDRPNIIVHGETGLPPVENQTPDYYLDMLHRGFGSLAVSDRPASHPPGIVAGVVSHVAERLALGDGLEGDFAPLGEVVSVGGLFERASAAGIGFHVLSDSPPPDLQLGPEASAVLSDSLGQGWLAIVPESPVEIGGQPRLGWWLVDRETGRTIDQMDDGRGSSSTEHPITVAIGLYSKGKWVRGTICLLLFLKFLYSLIQSIVTISAWPFFSSALLHALLHKPIHWLGCH